MARPVPLISLVIDDDADTRANLCDILELDEYRVETAGTIRCRGTQPHRLGSSSAIILDRKLPDGTAEDSCRGCKQLAPEAAVIIVTGYADLEGAIAAIRQGAADYHPQADQPDCLAHAAGRHRPETCRGRNCATQPGSAAPGDRAAKPSSMSSPCLHRDSACRGPLHGAQPLRREADRHQASDVLGKDPFLHRLSLPTGISPAHDPGPLAPRLAGVPAAASKTRCGVRTSSPTRDGLECGTASHC